MKFKQITIIGVGLIGGSIGLAVKKRRLAGRVIGVTAHKETLKKAIKCKAVDTGTLDIRRSVAGSDMVILAVPVDKILPTLKSIVPYLKNGCIVIDVASVKGPIVKKAEVIIRRKALFIGTHPMAGSEQRGVDKAELELFKGAPCIITKTSNTDRKALRTVESFWKKLGSKIYELSPAEHDRKVSNVSHLPHVAAFCLAQSAERSLWKFAASGLIDTTRIASSDPALWASILLSNRTNAAGDIRRYIKQLKQIERLIAAGAKDNLRRYLAKAKKKRDKFVNNERA